MTTKHADQPVTIAGYDPAVLAPRWYVVSTSTALKRQPLWVALMGSALVLFRNRAGKVAALLDRCAHRNVPLSRGRVVNDWLQCAYHGWCFDQTGACRHIPALIGTCSSKARTVDSYATTEQHGYIWIYAQANTSPLPMAYTPTEPTSQTARHWQQRWLCSASLWQTAENILDVAHTVYLHGGLFRSTKHQRQVEVQLQHSSTAVEAHYQGEALPAGLLARLLGQRNAKLEHCDRFLLPCIAEVEYRLGTALLRITNFLTPCAPMQTMIHTRITIDAGRANGKALLFGIPLSRWILWQDQRMLALQSRTIEHHGGEHFSSSKADLLGPYILRLLQGKGRAERLRTTSIMM